MDWSGCLVHTLCGKKTELLAVGKKVRLAEIVKLCAVRPGGPIRMQCIMLRHLSSDIVQEQQWLLPSIWEAFSGMHL